MSLIWDNLWESQNIKYLSWRLLSAISLLKLRYLLFSNYNEEWHIASVIFIFQAWKLGKHTVHDHKMKMMTMMMQICASQIMYLQFKRWMIQFADVTWMHVVPCNYVLHASQHITYTDTVRHEVIKTSSRVSDKCIKQYNKVYISRWC